MVSPESLERVLVRSLLQSFTDSLIECLRMPGARTPARLATWTKDTPELKLNLSLVAEAFLQLLASGLGTLALVWATVVLLGGYSTMLVRLDFWFTTAIVFVETDRYVMLSYSAQSSVYYPECMHLSTLLHSFKSPAIAVAIAF